MSLDHTKRNKSLVIGMTMLLALAVIGQNFIGVAFASRQESDQLGLSEMDYLDPFSFEVTSFAMARSQAAPQAIEQMSMATPTESDSGTIGTLSGDSPPYRVPPKVWIPYKPTFRSPCVPTW